MQMRVVAQLSVFAAVQLKSVLWSSYRAHARPPSCRVVHRYPLIVCHFGVECKTAHKRLQLLTCKLIAIPFEASNGENPMWTRSTSCTAPRPRPQSTPQGRTLRCAPYRWRGRPAQATSGCARFNAQGAKMYFGDPFCTSLLAASEKSALGLSPLL